MAATETTTIPATTTQPEIVVTLPKKSLDPQELIQKQLDTIGQQMEQVKFVTVIVGSLIGAVAAAILRAFILTPFEEKKKAERVKKMVGNPLNPTSWPDCKRCSALSYVQFRGEWLCRNHYLEVIDEPDIPPVIPEPKLHREIRKQARGNPLEWRGTFLVASCEHCGSQEVLLPEDPQPSPSCPDCGKLRGKSRTAKKIGWTRKRLK